jgi:hypothetical protein
LASKGGVANVKVFLGGIKRPKAVMKSKKKQISDITKWNDFLFTPKGVTVKRQSGIGSGIHVPLVAMAIKCEYQCTILTETVDAPTGGHDVPQGLQYDIRRIRQLHKSSMQDVPQVGNVDVDDPTETVEMLDIGGTVSAKKGLFQCSVPQCSARYLSQRGLDKHEITGMCHFRKHQQTTQGEAQSIFFSKWQIPKGLEPAARANARYFKTHLTTLEDVELPDDLPMKEPDVVQDAEYLTTKKGYALPIRKAPFVYKDKHRIYMKRYFDEGNLSQGSNVKPDVAAQRLKDEKHADGSLVFDFTEHLEPHQCQYLFAYFKAKLKKSEETGALRRRTLVDLDLDPAEIMDARMDIEASQMRQEEEEVIQKANALVGEANDSNEHPITVTIIVILFEYS